MNVVEVSADRLIIEREELEVGVDRNGTYLAAIM